MLNVRYLNDNETPTPPVDEDQQALIFELTTDIKFMAQCLVNQVSKVLEIQKDRSYLSFYASTIDMTEKLKFICGICICLLENLDKLFQLSASPPPLSQVQVEEMKQKLRQSVAQATHVRQLLQIDNEVHARRCTRLCGRYPVELTRRRYLNAVGRGRFVLIKFWKERLTKACGIVNRLAALKACDDSLGTLETLIHDISQCIPRLDSLARKGKYCHEAGATAEEAGSDLNGESHLDTLFLQLM